MQTRESPYFSVAEDVAYLRTKWGKPPSWGDPPADEVRRGSGVLRLLLVDNAIRQAWRHHGFPKQPTITAGEIVASGPAKAARLISLAGCWSQTFSAALSPEEQVQAFIRKTDFSLRDFVESPCVVIGDDREVIRRREVVQYFAHISGGVHLEVSHRRERANEELVRRARKVEGQMKILGMDALRRELLEIGRAVGHSTDLQQLESVIRGSAVVTR